VAGKRSLVFAGAGAFAVVLLMVIFLLLPKLGEISEAETQLEDARRQQQVLLSQKAALEDAKDRRRQNERIIAEVDQKVPPVVDEQGIIVLLTNAAEKAGMEVVSLTPSNPVFDDVTGITTVTVTVSALGTYFDVTEFMYLVETLPRAAKVMAVTLAPVAEDVPGVPELTMAGTIELYTSDASAGPGSVPGPTEGNAEGNAEGTGG
jgi:Tfp pilus assembly protein PilO